MSCPLCNDTGDQRYWEGRWRDERVENDRLRALLVRARNLWVDSRSMLWADINVALED
jgi:hypothetical protein